MEDVFARPTRQVISDSFYCNLVLASLRTPRDVGREELMTGGGWCMYASRRELVSGEVRRKSAVAVSTAEGPFFPPKVTHGQLQLLKLNR